MTLATPDPAAEQLLCADAPALDRAAVGVPYTVRSVLPPPHAPDWAEQLEEIGFIPGERVMVMAQAPWGGDPLVVRVGESTFALRRAEASCVQLAASA